MKISILKKLTPIVLLALSLSPLCMAQPQVAGDWLGTLNTGGPQLHLVLHIAAAKDGSLTATLDSVDQGANGIPVSAVSLKDSQAEPDRRCRSWDIRRHRQQRSDGDRRHVVARTVARTELQAWPRTTRSHCRGGTTIKARFGRADDFVIQAMKDWEGAGTGPRSHPRRQSNS